MSELTKPILIDGKWRVTGKTFEVKSPFSGEILAETFYANETEIEEAIVSAVSASAKMRELSRFELVSGLSKIAEGIAARKEEFARTIALEAAKPWSAARTEVERAISTFEIASGEARSFVGDVVPVDVSAAGRGKFAWTERIPRGVIFGITPFNFPINLVAHKVAPALASKNAIIIKPSPRTPLTSLLLGEVFLESGLPSNSLQIVNIENERIEKVLRDERIAMFSFTGSALVGWEIKAKANKKQVALELGGNAPVIIDETCDWRKTVEKSVAAAFAYAGQVCISAQRFYLHHSIFDEWTSEFVQKAQNLKRGNPLDETTQLSVMIDEAAAKRAESWINEATENGAKLLCGGKRDGAFLEATVLTATSNEMRVVSEEVFAPVAVVEKFATFEEALNLANETKYGLQCGVFTNDLARMQLAGKTLDFGGILINDVPTFRVDNMPYGGVKDSGFGREGVRYAMEEMCETRLIVVS